MKPKYVRVREKKCKHNLNQVYDGIEIFRNKEYVTIIGVGPDKTDPIRQHDLDLELYEVKAQPSDQIKHYFHLSLLSTEKELLNKEFDFIDAKNKLRLAKERSEKYFGKLERQEI